MAKRSDAVQRIAERAFPCANSVMPTTQDLANHKAARALAAKIRKLSNARYLEGMKDERERIAKAVRIRLCRVPQNSDARAALENVLNDISGPLSGAPVRARRSK